MEGRPRWSSQSIIQMAKLRRKYIC